MVLIAVLALAGLVAMPAAWTLLGGLTLTGVSFAVGLGAGLLYHRHLFAACGGRPSGWWLDPTVHHRSLIEPARSTVLRWFRLGVGGFGGVMVGLVLLVTGFVKLWATPSQTGWVP